MWLLPVPPGDGSQRGHTHGPMTPRPKCRLLGRRPSIVTAAARPPIQAPAPAKTAAGCPGPSQRRRGAGSGGSPSRPRRRAYSHPSTGLATHFESAGPAPVRLMLDTRHHTHGNGLVAHDGATAPNTATPKLGQFHPVIGVSHHSSAAPHMFRHMSKASPNWAKESLK